MLKFLAELGRLGSILLITVIGLFCALVITVGVLTAMNQNGRVISLQLALQIVAIVTVIGSITLGTYLANAAIEAQALQEEMQSLASCDALTSLLNRRVFIERAAHLFNIAVRGEEDFSIVIINIDHFKNINDVHGHTAGDQALAAFGKLLRTTLRKSDLACRYSGKEFALCLPKTNDQQAWIFSERIHQLTKNNGLYYNEHKIIPTLSIGMVSFPNERAETAEGLFSLADRALHYAKETGRNKTVSYVEGI